MTTEKVQNSKKEPLVRVVKRGEAMPLWKCISIRAGAILAALVLNALFVYLVIGLDPISMYSQMFRGTFGNKIFTWKTIATTVKLLCIAIALAAAFKMKFWNIGGEGQVLVGALATAIVMNKVGDSVPSIVLFLLMALASIVAGGIWGVIPAIFKAKWNTNETLFTLMMNYVAIQLVSYFCNKWKGQASTLGKLNVTTQAGWFPEILGQRYTINVIVVLVLMVLMYIYLSKTKQGYEIAVVGESQNTARYAGINVKKVIIRTMIISGAICGLCGFLNVAGQDQTISTATAGGFGFTAIIVAWMANFNTLIMLLISLFIVFLQNGTAQIANKYSSFSTSASSIVIGIILFFVIGCEFFIRYKLVFRSKSATKGE